MRILLIGGGSGGHITPLLAVARELKKLDASVELIGVCEKDATFVHLFQNESAVDRVFQVRAGKYRRYAGLGWYQRLFDIKTLLLNIRDVGRTAIGYIEAKRLLKELKPDALLIKGGFVGVPMGLAAAKLGIPFATHDSDSTPGLANRIVSRWATLHATGMPAELYNYPPEKTVYTGIPVSDNFKKVSPSLRATYREGLGLSGCSEVVTIVGGSQGAGQLNQDVAVIVARLMQAYPSLGIVHVAGEAHKTKLRQLYDEELLADEGRRVVVQGFVDNVYASQGAADVVVSRAGATQMAELSLQALPVIVVPGQLAGGHQDKNAALFTAKEAAVVVPHADAEGLFMTLSDLLSDNAKRKVIGENLSKLAKPDAAKDLAKLTLGLLGDTKQGA